jgi:ABC-type branched-subunit amino acid transport system substrate-binding protein
MATLLAAAPTRAQDVVKIGFASPLTGGRANYGRTIRTARRWQLTS